MTVLLLIFFNQLVCTQDLRSSAYKLFVLLARLQNTRPLNLHMNGVYVLLSKSRF